MQEVSIKQTGPISTEMDFLIQKSEVDQQLSKFCDEIKSRVVVDGFRKGTAPLSVIRQKFASQIKTEVSARLISEKTETAIKESGLKVVGNPSLKSQYKVGKDKQWIGHFRLDGGFEYGIEAELEPELEISGYRDIEVEVNLPNPETWIAGRIKEIQNNFAERVSVEREIALGDEVMLDLVAEVDGVKLDEGAVKWHTAVVGSGELTKEFESNLIGKLPGTHVDFTIDFQPDSEEISVAGKSVKFSVNIHTVTALSVPQVDDDLAKKAVFESVDHMMSELRANAEEEFAKPRKAKQFEAVMSALLEKNPFVVPNAWVDNEVVIIAKRLGMKKLPEDAANLNGLREIAVRSVKQSFVLDKIYQKEESIHLKPEEIEKLLAGEAQKSGKTSSEILAYLKNSGNYEGFISFSEHMKTIDFLVSVSKIKETV